MKKQTQTIIIIILGLLTAFSFSLGLIGFLNHAIFAEKNKPIEKEEKPNEEENNEENKNNDTSNYVLNVYKDDKENICLKLSSDCYTLANTIKTETHNAKILSVSAGSKYILINDGKIKLVDLINRKIENISLENTYSIYTLNTTKTEDEEILYGIVYYNITDRNETETGGYYNYKTEKKTARTYDYMYFINDEYIAAANYTTKKDYILDLNTGEEIFEFKRSEIKNFKCSKEYPEPTYFRTPDSENFYLTIFKNKDKNIIEIVCKNEENENILYTMNGTEITERALIEILDDEIYTIKDNVLIIYNFDGLAKETKSLAGYNFELITQNYAVGTKNNDLVIVNLNTLEETKLMTWTNDYYFADRNVMKYGYALSGIHEDNKNKIGIYIIIGDSSRQKINGLGQGFEIYFNPNTKKVETYSIAKIENAV